MLKRIIAATAATTGMTGVLVAGAVAPAHAETCVSGSVVFNDWNEDLTVCANID